MRSMRVIIAGSRTFNDPHLLHDKMDQILQASLSDNIEIVSGCALGADTLGIEYAANKGYSLKRFPADWERHGKRAGYIRNKQMADYATHLVAFWDGKSHGTEMMIEFAKQNSLPTRVIYY